MSDDELEEIRRRKEQDMKDRLAQQQQRQSQEQQIEAQKNAIMRMILDPDARTRLTNIKMVKPQFAAQIELQLIQLAQGNQLQRMGFQLPMSDEQFKKLLIRISETDKKEKFTIRRV